MTILRSISATPGQRLLWLMEHYRGSDSPLNVTACYRLHGQLDRDALRAALDGLIVRHEALRTTYELAGRRLTQHVHSPEPVTLLEQRVGDDPDELAAAMTEHARARHDITVAPVHFALLEISPDDFVLIQNIHHLSTDGWSGGVISQDLSNLYRPAAASIDVAELPPVTLQYADFSEWLRHRYDEGVLADSQRFWRDRLAGAARLPLPGTSEMRTATGQLPGFAAFTLDTAILSGLNALCRQHRATSFVVNFALFLAVLRKRTGAADLAVASMFANRIRPEFAGTVGFFANLLVLRVETSRVVSFIDLLTVTRDTILDSLGHQEVPYHLVPQAQGERGSGLEDVLFQLAVGPDYALRLDGMDVAQVTVPGEMASRFDLEFVLMPAARQIDGQVWYDRRRFEPAWVRELIADYRATAAAAIAEPARPVFQRA